MQINLQATIKIHGGDSGCVTINTPPLAPLNPDFDVTSTQASIKFKWSNPSPVPASYDIYKSTDGTTYTLFTTVLFGVTQITDATGMAAGNIWYYKVRSRNGALSSAFTSPISVSYNLTIATVGAVSLPTLTRAFGFIGLTTSSATTIDLSALKSSSGGIAGNGKATITSLNLSSLVTATDINFNTCLNLATVTLTSLQTWTGYLFLYSTNIPSLVLPVATNGGFIAFSNNNLLTSISLPNLQSLTGDLVAYFLPAITSISAPNLLTVGVNVNLNDSSYTSISLPQLQLIGGYLNAGNNPSLASFSAPNLTGVNGVDIFFNNCPLLTSFTTDLSAIGDGGTIDFTGCALPIGSSSSPKTGIDGILRACVDAPLTTSTIDLSGGTNATPDISGQADVATLTINGCAVTTN